MILPSTAHGDISVGCESHELCINAMNLPPIWFYSAIAVRTIIVAVCLVVGVRLFGKRLAGGLNILDLLLVLLLGNAVQNAITVGSGELAVGLVSVACLLIIDRLIGILFVRNPFLESRFFGAPTILVTNGKLNPVAMRHEGVSEDEVLTAIHEQGLSDLSQVKLGMLEEDGTISIVPKEDHNQS
jgi:uncharacterized membrane protein YcaP (DUF421 family)